MFLHENERCPVCDKPFTADDDIVVCPNCATPHHRQCYNELSHCANQSKHSEDFLYKADKTEAQQSQKTENIFSNKDEAEQNVKHCASCGKQVDKSDPFCYNCGQRQENPDYKTESVIGSIPDYNDHGEAIDGVRVRDIVAVVKTNSQRFLNKFRSQKKISWNWGAFFFGPYYLMFRKMYRPGILVMAMNLIVTLVVNGLYFEPISALISFIIREQLLTMSAKPTAEVLNEFYVLVNDAMPALMILSLFNIIMSVVVAMIADNLYKSKVFSIISIYEKNHKVEAEAMDQMSPLFKEKMNFVEENRTSALRRMGGTTIIAPILAYFVLDIIQGIIGKI